MEAYKFETTIRENGLVQIPEMAGLAHQRVEIFIVVPQPDTQETKPSQSIEAFLDKWRGFLKRCNPDEQ
jgi:hypothetical protein